MHHITFTFAPIHEPINGRFVTALSIHGMLFNILAQADRAESDWLHQHDSPRPFSFVPLYTNEGHMAGMRLAAITERVATLLIRTGEWFQKEKRPCHLNGQEFVIQEVTQTPGLSWQQLAYSQPVQKIGLRFISPTAFKQGPGYLRFPLSGNVFASPVRIWKAFAPPMMSLPDDWLEWCRLNVFVTRHQIETVSVKIRKQQPFIGFVGEAWFEAHRRDAHRGDDQQLRTWQALAELATFCGVGYKTTMGMGAVERM